MLFWPLYIADNAHNSGEKSLVILKASTSLNVADNSHDLIR
jgi:hypothetical protein